MTYYKTAMNSNNFLPSALFIVDDDNNIIKGYMATLDLRTGAKSYELKKAVAGNPFSQYSAKCGVTTLTEEEFFAEML